MIKIPEVTLSPKDHANLTLFKVNAYAILTIGFGVATYFLIQVYDRFLRGTVITQDWAILTIIGISCLVYSLLIGFIAYWIKAYIDAFIIWFYGQFLYKEKQSEKKLKKMDEKK